MFWTEFCRKEFCDCMLVVALDMIGLKIGSYGLRGAIAGPGPCMGSAGLPVPKGAGASAGNCTINIYIYMSANSS